MAIDPRLTERRREVAEDRARRNVTRLVRLLVVLAVIGAVVWLFLSPLLSVKAVTASGIVASDANSTLAEEGVVVGRPMILVDAGDVVAALERDPWVGEATVDKDWPNQVQVTIVERVPVAWVESSDGWDRRAVDGVVLPVSGGPDDTMPNLTFTDVSGSEAGESSMVLGALEFAASLPQDLWAGTTMRVGDNNELWAVVSGYEVRLGRPTEMTDKALSLRALLAKTPPVGSTLVLIAPTNPAVAAPGSEAEQP
jgi:cell division protein FtsQ